MKKGSCREKRRFNRYDTDLKIQFYVKFDIRTKIDFLVIKKDQIKPIPKKYTAFSRNINAEGLSFRAPKKLTKGDRLVLFVYVPSSQESILMEGEVRWSKRDPKSKQFNSGVRLVAVEGNSVEKSLTMDPVYKMPWSVVLESVFGSFKHLIQQTKPSPPD